MKKLFLVLLVLVCFITGCKNQDNTKYTVTFNDNGVVYKTTEYTANEEVDFDHLTKEGYTFKGWSLNGEIVTSHKVVDNVTFDAVYEINKYTVTFINDGKESSVDYKYGDSVEFPIVEKDHHKFEGWSLNGELVDSYNVYENVTFEAVFTELDLLGEVEQYLINNLPAETIEDVELPTEYNGVSITWTTSNSSAISKTGTVTQLEYKATVTLTAKLSHNGETKNVKIKVIVPKLSDEEILNNVLNAYEFNASFNELQLDLLEDFSTNNSRITSTWESLNKDYLTNDGKMVLILDSETNVQIKLTLTLRETQVSKIFDVVIPALSISELAEMAVEKANIQTNVTTNKVLLPTEFEYDLVGVWSSSDPTIMDNQGNVTAIISGSDVKDVKMTVVIKDSKGVEVKTMEFNFKVQNKTHLPILHAKDFNPNNMDKVEVVNNKLVLKQGETYGEYESDIIDVISFNELVPSWAAISSTNATVEFLVKARVNGTWSKYISYCSGGWGLGLQNKAADTSDTLVKLATDEFKVLNSKSADAVQFKLILRRTNASIDSAQVSLVSLALKGTSYSAQTYDLDNLPSYVKHDVPKLYQGAVPSIGNSICSPTSATMLLKYKGMDFTANDSQYEHRYIANLAKDYGNGIFGNWVYNTVTMSAYGFDAYVARFYSVEELCHHIATVGPVACSMKGQMTSDMKDYYTAGHLITIIGYEYKDGVLTLISNDPNVPSVECRYSRSVFTSTWRNISYVIE